MSSCTFITFSASNLILLSLKTYPIKKLHYNVDLCKVCYQKNSDQKSKNIMKVVLSTESCHWVGSEFHDFQTFLVEKNGFNQGFCLAKKEA